MDILFLGGLFPTHLFSEIIKNSRGKIDFAANNLQWSLVDGLDICNSKPVQICNVMLIGSFPKGYKKPFIQTESFSHRTGSQDLNMGFLNLASMRLFSRLLASMKGIIKWTRKNKENKIIVIYGIHTPYLLASIIIHFFYLKLRTCLIVPDLPQYMSESKNILYRLLKSLDKIIINFCLKRIDAFVLLSEYMHEELNVGQKPWERVEGIFSAKRYDFISKKNTFKTVMYSGNLDENQGINQLLDAFAKIGGDDYRLWITGNGNALPAVLKAAEKDYRINYWTNLEQNDLFKMLQEATLLINPLSPIHHKARYFFPSKTIEYMASGTPVLMYKLPCIPEEYHRYLIYLEDNSQQTLCDKIVEVCSMTQDELMAFGKASQEFILREKNPEVQCRKIYSMLENFYN